MEIIQVKVSELKPADYNPRKLTKEQHAHLKESMEKFGLVDPIIVNRHAGRENVVIGGHQRLKIAQEMALVEVPVIYLDLDEEQEKELNLRLNKNLGEWDWDMLANQFDVANLKEIGFTSNELGFMKGEAEEDEFDAAAEATKITEPESKLGEIYELGTHRLMCGDSTNREHVEKLMNGEKADLVFTDPPYNVNYNYAKYEAIHRGRKKKFLNSGKIFNDNKTEEQFYHFLLDVFNLVNEFTKDSAALYCCFATKSEQAFRLAYEDAGFLFSQMIIWLKERIILALGQDYHRIYEPILFGWKKGKKHYSNRMITNVSEFWMLDKQTFAEHMDVWFEQRDKSIDYDHPTQKPIKLPGRAIRKSCPDGGLMYEPFGGSGSTMMAAEQLGRRCFSMELDPIYCDVIRKRYARFKEKGLKG
jgi:DNA modification methylase